MNLVLFPLPVYLLPGGVTRLRIFEPRYMKMVSEATKKSCGFVLCVYIEDTHLNVPNWGTRVEVINFSQGSDGILEVDVKALELVHVENTVLDGTNLRRADCKAFNHWPEMNNDDFTQSLSVLLANNINNISELGERYITPEYDNAAWVVQRWLELLPIPITTKMQFVSPQSLPNAIEFLKTVFHTENMA